MTDNIQNDEIDLREFLMLLWSSKSLIIGLTFLAAVVSVGYSLMLPNIYQSNTLLSAAEDSGGGIGSMLGQYSGLASIAGVSVPLSDSVSKTALALEVMRSRAFIHEFIRAHDILPALLAVDHWDETTRELKFKSDLYNVQSGKWVGQNTTSGVNEPSIQEAVRKFRSIMSIDRDQQTNLVTVSIKHESPDVAQNWVELLVQGVNETMRKKEIKEAEESIKYLKDQAAKTVLADLDQVFFELMQSQMQRMMLAQVRREYALVTIDPAISPEVKSEPTRFVICILGSMLGAIIGVVVALLRRYLRGDKATAS